MKKYLLTTALAALALVGCSKVAPNNAADDDQVAIDFLVAKYAPQVKALGTGQTEYSTGSTFGTYALYTGSTDWTDSYTVSNAVKYMDDVTISWQTSVWKASSGTYYWPKGGKLTFASYSPKDAALSLGSTTGALLTKTGYSVPATFSAQQTATTNGTNEYPLDLMVADLAPNKTQNVQTYTKEGVPTLFRHTLAKIAFTAKASTLSDNGITFHIILNSVAIEDIFNKADFSWNSTNHTASWTSLSNTTTGETADKKSGNIYTGPTDNNGTSGTYAAVTGELTTNDPAANHADDLAKPYFVIPQALNALDSEATNKQVVKVSYTVYSCNGTTILDKSTYNQTVQLKGLGTTAINSWDPNKYYTYNIIISPLGDEIYFDPAVQGWDEVDADINLPQ